MHDSRCLSGALSGLVIAVVAVTAGPACQGQQPAAATIPSFFIGSREPAADGQDFLLQTQQLRARFDRVGVEFQLPGGQLSLRFAGADARATAVGTQPLPGRANFLIGDEPQGWRTGLPLFSAIEYRGLYPGVDLRYAISEGRLKSEFVIRAGADPGDIRLSYTNAARIRIEADGSLEVQSDTGRLRESPPVAFQRTGAGRVSVASQYRMLPDGAVGFRIGPYDARYDLIIDPELQFSTLLGGSSLDYATDLAVTAEGEIYLAGWTDSVNFPAVQPLQNRGGSVDAFVVKFNAAATEILYATYIGGSGDDRASSVAVDGAGNVFLTGYTSSTNFPRQAALQNSLAGGRDAFIVKLAASGTSLLFSTYWGGAGQDEGRSVAVDGAGNAYVAGGTYSSNFPVSGAFQNLNAGGQDAFLTKIGATGILHYSTLFGGQADDIANGVAVDAGGSAYITGRTQSANLPALGALQPAPGGGQDAFIAKFSAGGSQLAYSTYLGGTGGGIGSIEEGVDIKVDAAGSAYVVGSTSSTDFPLYNPVQGYYGGGGVDAFVAKLTPDGRNFAYCTYVGGKGSDYGTAIVVDAGGKAIVAGHTSSTNFPAVNPIQASMAGVTDAYVVKLDAIGSAFLFGTYLGGSLSDGATAVGLTPGGLILAAGTTQSSNFPARGALQPWLAGGVDSFLARIADYAPAAPQAVAVSPSVGDGSVQTFDFLYADLNGFDEIQWAYVLFHSQLNQAGGCYVQYKQNENTLWLRNDAGNAWMGPLAAGLPGSLENSQCAIQAQSASVALSGFSLALRLTIAFNPGFSGTKTIYMYAADTSGLNSGWQSRGAWATQLPAPPQSIAAAPPSGSGISQSFAFTFADDNGFQQLGWVYALFNTQLTGSNSCYIQYRQSDNTLWLRNDAGSAWIGPVAVGSSSALENGQCAISAGASSVARQGIALTLTTTLTFKPAFAGPKNIYLYAIDTTGLNSGWQQRGSWTTQAPLAPAAVSAIVPMVASTLQTFSFAFSDGNGYQDLSWTYGLIHSVLNQAGACYAQYKRSDATLWLRNDAGTAWIGPLPAGAAGTLENSQCALHGQMSYASGEGSTMILNLAFSFKPAFNGSKKVYMYAIDSAGLNSGWQQRGTVSIAVP
ncbi:MAG: SBBP repeat-containing protein [Bryobacteraceae bacterium]|nr:SBBP repeat-containing protein [Bryobacteraceae bacterium]